MNGHLIGYNKKCLKNYFLLNSRDWQLEKSQSHDDEDIEMTIKTIIKGTIEVKGAFTKCGSCTQQLQVLNEGENKEALTSSKSLRPHHFPQFLLHLLICCVLVGRKYM